MNKEQTLEMAETVSGSVKTIALQNHIINFADSNELTKDNIMVHYTYLTRALDDIFDLNQNVMNDLDQVVAYLYELAETEDKDNETH